MLGAIHLAPFMRRTKQLYGSICVAQVLQSHNCRILQAAHARQAICQL
jgi:hypothetical protein